MKSINVALVDDHPVFLAGLKQVIEQYNGIEVIFEAKNANTLFKNLKFNKPDIILLDMSLPDKNGLEITKKLKIKYPNIKIIILTSYVNDIYVSTLIKAGVNSYLLKENCIEEVEKAIRQVYNHDIYFTEFHYKALKNINRNYNKINLNFKGIQLTPRENEVLTLICMDNKLVEIAEILKISPKTIEGIILRLKDKTGTKTLTGLVKYAYMYDLVQPDF